MAEVIRVLFGLVVLAAALMVIYVLKNDDRRPPRM